MCIRDSSRAQGGTPITYSGSGGAGGTQSSNGKDGGVQTTALYDRIGGGGGGATGGAAGGSIGSISTLLHFLLLYVVGENGSSSPNNASDGVTPSITSSQEVSGGKGVNGANAVSYTHLDVYKRQIQKLRH